MTKLTKEELVGRIESDVKDFWSQNGHPMEWIALSRRHSKSASRIDLKFRDLLKESQELTAIFDPRGRRWILPKHDWEYMTADDRTRLMEYLVLIMDAPKKMSKGERVNFTPPKRFFNKS